MSVALPERPTEKARRESAGTKPVAWQGLTVRVPTDWDVTGFSGDAKEGYLRIDDGDTGSLELKWATHGLREKAEPDPEVRAESYLLTLQKAAKKKKLGFESRVGAALKGVVRPERLVSGFTWSGDRKAVGTVVYCRTSRRIVIAQVVGSGDGRAPGRRAEEILKTLECFDAESGWRRWALYDLDVTLPADFALTTPQVMNVYVKLGFVRKAEKLTVEQWSVADVARRGAFLDTWLCMNSRGELRGMKTTAEETQVREHGGVTLTGRPEFGMPMLESFKTAAKNFHAPALRFSAVGWECEPGNKIYLVQHTRPRKALERASEIARRLACHVVEARP